MNSTIALPQKIRSRRREQFFQQFLRPAGIQLNGRRPFDLTVRNDAFYDRPCRAASRAFSTPTWTAGGNATGLTS